MGLFTFKKKKKTPPKPTPRPLLRAGAQPPHPEPAGENNFIYNVLGASALDEYWLGGRQNPSASDYSEPGGGYRWLTGEQLSGAYENWAPGEPNDAGAGEDSVAYVKAAEWADIEGTSLINEGYVIEFPTGALVGEPLRTTRFPFSRVMTYSTPVCSLRRCRSP